MPEVAILVAVVVVERKSGRSRARVLQVVELVVVGVEMTAVVIRWARLLRASRHLREERGLRITEQWGRQFSRV